MERTGSPSYEKHPTLYYPDGDIVLCAPTSSGISIVFRVDRVYLIRNSPVLRDMLSPATGSPQPETFDGVPLLRLGDDAHELANLLELLYSSVTVSLQRLDPNTPLRAMGILRLATKYGMDPLRKLLLQCIAADWPQTLQEWDHLQAQLAHAKELSIAAGLGSARKAGTPLVDDTFPEPAAAIALASEFACPAVLPAAFYQLAVTDPTADWDEHRSCSVADDPVGAWEYESALARGTRTARWSLLDRANLVRYVRGRARLDEWLSDIEDCLTSYLGTAECVEMFQCGEARGGCRRHFILEGPGRARPFDPLYAIRYLLDALPRFNLCCSCSRHIRKELLRVRQEIWDEIPTMFGIGTAPPSS